MTLALESPPAEQIHIWHARLDRDDPPLELAERWLSRSERERAARFHFERDRRRFLAAHLFLRSLLSRYLDCSPSEVVIGRASEGKPILVSPSDELSFNLSQSGELAVIAIGHAREVGVDVEQLGPAPFPDRLTSRVLSARELAELEAAEDGAERQRAFLRAWTRKEALLKAWGTGIAREPATIDVGTGGGLQPRVITLAGEAGVSTHWSIVSFEPARGHIGAVAARGPGLDVLLRPT